jgi:hypothetical protein
MRCPLGGQQAESIQMLGRTLHLVLFTVGSIACIVFGRSNGLPWAGLAVAMLLASRAARSALFLMPRAGTDKTAGQIASTIGKIHGVGFLGAALLFVASSLRGETGWSLVMAAGSFGAALLDFWLVRRASTMR